MTDGRAQRRARNAALRILGADPWSTTEHVPDWALALPTVLSRGTLPLHVVAVWTRATRDEAWARAFESVLRLEGEEAAQAWALHAVEDVR